jgi:enamine deaminase RidA (YjgF/YER057c/UK114 family)
MDGHGIGAGPARAHAARRGGPGRTVVRFDGARHVHVAATADPGEPPASQVRSCLGAVAAALAEPGAQAVYQTVFLADPDLAGPCRDALAALHGEEMPATAFVAQRPCGGAALAVEAFGIAPDGAPVRVARPQAGVVRVESGGLAWVAAMGFGPRPAPGSAGVYGQTVQALSRLRGALAGAGVGLEGVVRTWLYLGDIVGPEGDTQRYKELNRARAAFYEGVEFLRLCAAPGRAAGAAFPASTGIGGDGRDLVVGALALESTRDDVRAVALENPRQTSAFAYAPRYSPRSPLFARAVAVVAGLDALVLVSGTASITDSESRHEGDAAAQTRETLDNVAALVGAPNLRRHGIGGLGATLADLATARVYVKRPEDYPNVRSICEERWGAVPAVYTIADVCRPELLVEIEAVAYPRPTAPRAD